jgi:hypothetical protein
MGVVEDRKKGGSLSGRWGRNCLYSFPDPAFKTFAYGRAAEDINCGQWKLALMQLFSLGPTSLMNLLVIL